MTDPVFDRTANNVPHHGRYSKDHNSRGLPALYDAIRPAVGPDELRRRTEIDYLETLLEDS